MEERKCKVCQRAFIPKSYKHKFCSRKCKERWRSVEWRYLLDEDPRPDLLKFARRRARKKGIPFRLTLKDIPAMPKDGLCPVLKIPLSRTLSRHGDGSPTLDRVKPELGYVPGNVRIISYRANTLKGDGTAEEHEAIAAYIRREIETPVKAGD